jgi:hypothetical protein
MSGSGMMAVGGGEEPANICDEIGTAAALEALAMAISCGDTPLTLQKHDAEERNSSTQPEIF